MDVKPALRRARRSIKDLLGRDVGVRPTSHWDAMTLGSGYGAWTFVPKAVRSPVVYSFGVGTDASFEFDLLERYDVEVYAFDPTPKAVAWIESQPLPPKFHFLPWGLASWDGSATFVLTSDPSWVSYRIDASPVDAFHRVELPVRRLSSIMRDLGHDQLGLLKLDIEGAEYDVVQDLLSMRLSISQLLVEFHYRRGRAEVTEARAAIQSLLRAGLALATRSDVGCEFCFVSTDPARLA